MHTLLLLIPLAAIIYEDFRYRAIHWIWIACMIIYILAFSTVRLNGIFLNILVVLLELLGVWGYFSWKSRDVVNIFKTHLGLGDVLFLLCMAGLFQPLIFIRILIIFLFLSIFLFYALKRLHLLGDSATVPLAGLLSVQLAVLLLLTKLGVFTIIIL